MKNPGTAKLLPEWIGPFDVSERIGSVAYRLMLPENMRIHNVFHVSLLEQYRTDGRCQPPPATLFLDGDVQYEVDEILDHRLQGRSKKRQFLVKWLGYGPEHNTWEPEGNLTNCSEVMQAYWDAQASVGPGRVRGLQLNPA